MPNPKKLIRRLLPGTAVSVAEKTYRKGRGVFWQTLYGFPLKGMKVVAVTGTNGKTTTASYINSVMQADSLKTAVFTTAYTEIAGVRQPNLSHMTVPSQRALQKFFAEARKAGVQWIILEITSHALDQGRIHGVKVEIAVVTNLTQEHLDYHKTMEAYAAAKARLLNPPYSPNWCILNADDKWFNYFKLRSSGQVIRFGEKAADGLQMTAYDLSAQGSSVAARYKGQHIAFTSQLIGKFNAYNALAAYAAGIAAGLKNQQIEKGIAALESVPGRMEQINVGQKFSVIVDYAYTPDALENVLTTLKEITRGQVILVFGATGDRDKTKRAPMGEIAARLADRVFLTDDETYTEDPQAIRQEVYKGIKNTGAKAEIVDDRRLAIKMAFAAATDGDTVLLAGLGHQDYRNMGGKKLKWDEREVALEELSRGNFLKIN